MGPREEDKPVISCCGGSRWSCYPAAISTSNPKTDSSRDCEQFHWFCWSWDACEKPHWQIWEIPFGKNIQTSFFHEISRGQRGANTERKCGNTIVPERAWLVQNCTISSISMILFLRSYYNNWFHAVGVKVLWKRVARLLGSRFACPPQHWFCVNFNNQLVFAANSDGRQFNRQQY